MSGMCTFWYQLLYASSARGGLGSEFTHIIPGPLRGGPKYAVRFELLILVFLRADRSLEAEENHFAIGYDPGAQPDCGR